MAIERVYEQIPATTFTADGAENGVITVADVDCFKVKMSVTLKADTLPNISLQIKRVLNSTQMVVGPLKKPIHTREDVSAYTVALNATVEAPEQKRPEIPLVDLERASYSEEPTVAKRVLNVDKYGNAYNADNPLSVQLSDGDVNIGTVNAEVEVQLSHIDNFPDVGDVADSTRIGDGVNELGINVDGSLNNDEVKTSVTLVSANNSVATSLATGGVYSGTSDDLIGYAGITVLVETSQDSAVDGLELQFSTDNVNFDRIKKTSIDTTGTGDFGAYITNLASVARYFRLKFTNGSTAADIRIQTMLWKYPPKDLTAFSGEIIKPSRDATVTKGITHAKLSHKPEVHYIEDDGNFIPIIADPLGSLHVQPEQIYKFDEMETLSPWTVIDSDTTNFGLTTSHVQGISAFTFDKINGAANSGIAGVEKTITSVDLSAFNPHSIIQTSVYLADLTSVSSIFVRIGTDNSNYNEWRVISQDLNASMWQNISYIVGSPHFNASIGTGMNQFDITYIAVGVNFINVNDVLSDIIFDHVYIMSNPHTTSTITAEVSSDISSPNVNVKKWGATNVSVDTGATDPGTLRVVHANDVDVNTRSVERDPLQKYVLHEIDEPNNSTTYFGKENLDGTWLVSRITEAGKTSTLTYANLSNNGGIASLTLAWADRAILVYEQIENLTGV